jgi:hypothetical protein
MGEVFVSFAFISLDNPYEQYFLQFLLGVLQLIPLALHCIRPALIPSRAYDLLRFTPNTAEATT